LYGVFIIQGSEFSVKGLGCRVEGVEEDLGVKGLELTIRV
jgi:hypothetical protein